MKKTHIVLHHSATKDGASSDDWGAIERFHTSYRYNGQIITKEHAMQMRSHGMKGVLGPWQGIGYHLGFERVGGVIQMRQGRAFDANGAHCHEAGMNRIGLGVCIVGNFDLLELDFELLSAAAIGLIPIMAELGIPAIRERVRMHREFATYKSCPGTKFPYETFLGMLRP